jgi:hypothetical protein
LELFLEQWDRNWGAELSAPVAYRNAHDFASGSSGSPCRQKIRWRGLEHLAAGLAPRDNPEAIRRSNRSLTPRRGTCDSNCLRALQVF